MSSILTFSNRSAKLFTLKSRFLITAKVLHSIRMCLTVQVVWQVKHCGCGSCFKMKEWVSLVWPIRNRDITTSSLLDFLDAGLHSPKVGWIWKSLLWMLLREAENTRNYDSNRPRYTPYHHISVCESTHIRMHPLVNNCSSQLRR